MCFAAPVPLWAWNDTGHMTVAEIAYRQLDDAQKQKVAEILKAHPHYQLYLTAHVPEGVNADEWAFLKAATWPDFVRPSRGGTPGELFKGPEITHFHQGPWHYMDIPYVPLADRDKINATTLPAAEQNVVTALDGSMKQLMSADTKPDDRAVAMAWLEHLCGDIHQPLHACTMYSSQYPQGDRGGNEEAIRADGYVMRLHAFWDDAMGTSDAYEAIVFNADHILGQPQYAKEKLPELTKDTTFASWGDESFRWGVALVYLNGRLRSAPYKDFDAKQITVEQVPALPASYLVNSHNLAELRAAEAGYRLAEQIRQVLAK